MKYCPICKSCYDDQEDRCPKDRIFLVEAFPGERLVDTKYRIDALIGQGGMGTVYRATHLELDRTIALKVVLPDLVSSGETLERFRREARATARLSHPNVITIYDFGVLTNGRAYLAMELLLGHSLRDELERNGILAPQRVLNIFKFVCEAVHAAHSAGVIHRDLKPDNIVIEMTELGTELIKVVDFGIAKLKESAGMQSLSLTGPGLVMGTPHYMSPEQCKGEELDVRSDIYSLGVMLYEMVSGQVPFDAPTPSAVIIQHAIDPPRRISQLNRSISPVLEAVIMKALAKSRQARQQTVLELFAELQSAIEPPLPVEVKAAKKEPPMPPAPMPASPKTTPKDPMIAASGILEGAYEPALRAGDAAELAAKLKPPSPPPAPLPVDKNVTAPLSDPPAYVSSSEIDSEAAQRSKELVEKEITTQEGIFLRELATLQGHEHVIKSLVYTPNGQYLISASSDGAIKIWDLKKKRVRAALHGHELSVNALAISANGELLASVSSDGSARIWQLSNEREIANFDNHRGSLRAVAFAPNGKWLVLTNDSNIELWDIHSRTLLTMFEGHARLVEAVEFSRDSSLIISGSVDETIRFWDTHTKSCIGTITCTDHCINALSCSIDGIVATAGKDGTVRLWDIDTRVELALLAGHKNSVRTIAFSKRGDYLASGDWGGILKLWDVGTGQELISEEAHESAILTVAFSPDEKQLASAGYDQDIKLWNIEGLDDL